MYTIIHEKSIRNEMDRSGTHFALLLVHIVCDTADDMPEPLPRWSAGSRCDVLENGGSTYELSHSSEWMLIENASRSIDFNPITADELNAIWEAD